MELLITHNANIFSKDDVGNNCLHLLMTGHWSEDRMTMYLNETKVIEEAIQMIAKHQIELFNDTNEYEGYTPLMVAINKGYYSIAKVLLRYNPLTVNQLDSYLDSPLHSALPGSRFCRYRPFIATTKCADIDFVRVLLKNKANVNYANTRGYSPLYIAAEHHNLELIKVEKFSKSLLIK